MQSSFLIANLRGDVPTISCAFEVLVRRLLIYRTGNTLATALHYANVKLSLWHALLRCALEILQGRGRLARNACIIHHFEYKIHHFEYRIHHS